MIGSGRSMQQSVYIKNRILDIKFLSNIDDKRNRPSVESVADSHYANQGHNLRPVLDNAQQKWNHPVITQWKKNYKDISSGQFSGQAIQSQEWRYSLYGDGSEELYNHEDDPNEWHNLAYDPASAELHRTVIDKLKAQLPKNF